MALVVNHNTSSANALTNLNRTNQSLSATMGRISLVSVSIKQQMIAPDSVSLKILTRCDPLLTDG